MKLFRRSFLQVVMYSIIGGVAAACGIKPKQEDLAEPGAADAPTLQNENQPAIKPAWNVRFFRPFKAVDHKA